MMKKLITMTFGLLIGCIAIIGMPNQARAIELGEVCWDVNDTPTGAFLTNFTLQVHQHGNGFALTGRDNSFQIPIDGTAVFTNFGLSTEFLVGRRHYLVDLDPATLSTNTIPGTISEYRDIGTTVVTPVTFTFVTCTSPL